MKEQYDKLLENERQVCDLTVHFSSPHAFVPTATALSIQLHPINAQAWVQLQRAERRAAELSGELAHLRQAISLGVSASPSRVMSRADSPSSVASMSRVRAFKHAASADACTGTARSVATRTEEVEAREEMEEAQVSQESDVQLAATVNLDEGAASKHEQGAGISDGEGRQLQDDDEALDESASSESSVAGSYTAHHERVMHPLIKSESSLDLRT